MHLVVGIIGVAAVFVFDEGEPVGYALVVMLRRLSGIESHSLLDAERGAGISQRTRRPYLRKHRVSTDQTERRESCDDIAPAFAALGTKTRQSLTGMLKASDW